MNSIISATKATEHAAATPPGDDLMLLSYALLATAMVIAAVATWLVTPKSEH